MLYGVYVCHNNASTTARISKSNRDSPDQYCPVQNPMYVDTAMTSYIGCGDTLFIMLLVLVIVFILGGKINVDKHFMFILDCTIIYTVRHLKWE